MGNMNLGNGVFWLGLDENINELHCNAYLIVDEGEGILFDPGSVLDFPVIYRDLSEIISLDRISHVVLHHQDPDLCSSLPLFEEKGLKAQIATHWRSSLLIKYYGVSSPFYIVNENENRLFFQSGRELRFIPAPYLHFPGALMTYDPRSGYLFSGDLFGAISTQWKPFADESYMEKMRTFHEHYIPGNDVIRPVMELLLTMNIETICPQHGSIIRSGVKDYILELRDLECGAFLSPVRRQLIEGGGYFGICNALLKRLISLFGRMSVLELFEETEVNLNAETGLLKDFSGDGEALWERLFSLIYVKRGIRWLTVIEPFVQGILKEYGIRMPAIYSTVTFEEQRKLDRLKEWNQRLIRLNREFKRNIDQTQEKLTKCPVTGLYNEDFFIRYLSEFLSSIQDRDVAVLFIGVDGMIEINNEFGESEGDKLLKSIAYILLNEKEKNHYVFRLKGPIFAYIIPENDRKEIERFADGYRTAIERSSLLIKPVTVSVGIVSLDEKIFRHKTIPEQIHALFASGKGRIEKARERGGNQVCFDVPLNEQFEVLGRVVIIEYDAFNGELLTEALESIGIHVRLCLHGSEAAGLVRSFHPDLVISEVYLTETDVFQIREELMESTREKEIPFILLSHQKEESSVTRAHSLGIFHYLKKPYMLSEVVGIVDHLIRRKRLHGA